MFPVHARTADEEQRVLLQDVPWAAYVAHYAQQVDQHAALRAYRDELRAPSE